MTKRVALLGSNPVCRGATGRGHRRLLTAGGAAAVAAMLSLAFSVGEAAAQVSNNPRISGLPVSACIKSTRFQNNNCSEQVQRIIANRFCRNNQTAPVVSWQTTNLASQQMSVLEEPSGTFQSQRWIQERTAGLVFSSITCTGTGTPETPPADDTPPPRPPANRPPVDTPPARPPVDTTPPPRPPAVDDIDETRLPGMRRERR